MEKGEWGGEEGWWRLLHFQRQRQRVLWFHYATTEVISTPYFEKNQVEYTTEPGNKAILSLPRQISLALRDCWDFTVTLPEHN